MIEITRGTIEMQPVIDGVSMSDCGAVVTFTSTVRDNSEGKRVLYKEIVPIWKKEFYEDDSAWIGHN